MISLIEVTLDVHDAQAVDELQVAMRQFGQYYYEMIGASWPRRMTVRIQGNGHKFLEWLSKHAS
jgi:hypothetical protein